jgi:hypothetical protein
MGERKTALILLLILCFTISFIPLVSAAEDSWTTLEPMPTARRNLGVAVVDGKIYAIEGYNGNYDCNYSTIFDVNEKYTPVDYIPEFPSWIILPLLLSTTLFIIICKKKLLKAASQQS